MVYFKPSTFVHGTKEKCSNSILLCSSTSLPPQIFCCNWIVAVLRFLEYLCTLWNATIRTCSAKFDVTTDVTMFNNASKRKRKPINRCKQRARFFLNARIISAIMRLVDGVGACFFFYPASPP